jgi:hypothetical protein
VVDSANAKLGKIMVLFGALPAYRIIHIKTLQHTEKLLTCQFVQLLEGQAGKAHGSGQGLMPATPHGTCTLCAAPPTAQSQLQTRNCACCPPRSRTTQQRACSRHGRRQMRSGCAYEAYIRLRQSTTGRSCWWITHQEAPQQLQTRQHPPCMSCSTSRRSPVARAACTAPGSTQGSPMLFSRATNTLVQVCCVLSLACKLPAGTAHTGHAGTPLLCPSPAPPAALCSQN